MTGLAVPLGVRIFSAPLSFDIWVTNNVEDFTFRSGVPGGFLDASIRFRRYAPIGQPDVTIWSPNTSAVSPDNISFKVTNASAAPMKIGDRFWAYDSSGNIKFNGDRFTVTNISSSGGTSTVSYAPASSAPIASGDTVTAKVAASFYDTSLLGFNKMVSLLNRVQIVDLRSMEIAWEGRIEQPARESEKDLWTLGVLGTSVFATDIERPMFYIDDQISSWVPQNQLDFFAISLSEDDVAKSLKVELGPFSWTSLPSGNVESVFEYYKFTGCDLEGFARFDATLTYADTSSTLNKMGLAFQMYGWDGSDSGMILPRALNNTSNFFRTCKIGTNFTDFQYARLYLTCGYTATSGANVTPGTGTYGAWNSPTVQPIRLDRWRNYLVTGADYPTNAVYPGQVVEDILGRFLNGGHDRQYSDNPYPGYVSPYSAYVDKSSTARMVSGWTFFDGTTAKELMDKICDEAQLTAYWAIWESNFNNTDDAFQSKCNFEFVNWPSGWGYTLTSEDGLTEQPDASNEYSYLYYKYSYDTDGVGVESLFPYWNTNLNSELDRQQITRSKFIARDQPFPASGGGGPIVDEVADFFNNVASRVKNSGQIKIARPVSVYDPGIGRPNGMARRLDPWMVRPGKLGKIIDLEPKANINDFNHGGVAPTRETDGTIMRMVNTEYDSKTNTCTVDLDQNASWSIPNQFIRPKPGKTTKGPFYR